jgi:hypothetical protein
MKNKKQSYEVPTLTSAGRYQMLVGGSVIRVPIQLGAKEGGE